MKFENLVKLSLVGTAGLTGCVSQQTMEQQQMKNISLPKDEAIVEALTIDGRGETYYFEIDANESKKGSTAPAITYFACGSDQMHEAAERFPQGAIIDLQKSSPYISRVLQFDNTVECVVSCKPSARDIGKALEKQY